MARKTEAYWKRRNEELEKKWNRKSQQTVEREILAYYRKSLANIQKDIQVLYSTFAKDNMMTMEQARKHLQGDEYRTWRMDIKEYIDQIDATGSNELMKELNTLAMRSRISRLDKLYSETLAEIGILAGKTTKSMDRFLTEAYKDLYYRNLYEVGHAVGFKNPPSKVDSIQVENMLRIPWSGKNYSQRIWKNDARLAKTIQDVIVQGIHRGVSSGKLARMVATRMEVGMSDATRLVRTELNYVQNKAALDGIAEAGLEFYQFNATLDTRTTPICRSHDGKVFPIDEASPGENMPPLHPRCRSTIYGCLDEGGRSGKGKRIARDAEGKNIHVPASMKYEDWKSVYIDKNKTLDEWKKANPAEAKRDTIETKGRIDNLRSTLADQRAKGASSAEKEKTVLDAGRILAGEVRGMQFPQKIDLGPFSKEITEARKAYREAGTAEERARLRQIYDEKWNAYVKAREQNDNITRAKAKQMADFISQYRDVGATREQLKKQFGRSTSKVRKTFEAAMNCYPAEWIRQSVSQGTLKPTVKTRGYYSPGQLVIATSGDNAAGFQTAIHETAHRMEHVLSELLEAETEFYKRRTKGEELKSLRTLTGIKYRADEKARKDKFLNPYMGKDYGGSAYELLSMGTELIYTNPEYILEKDAEMAEWILGLLVLY